MTESDPRIEGFIKAISLYFGIPYSELLSVARGVGLARSGTDTTLAPSESTTSAAAVPMDTKFVSRGSAAAS
jgi:hypothetical protein